MLYFHILYLGTRVLQTLAIFTTKLDSELLWSLVKVFCDYGCMGGGGLGNVGFNQQ